MNTFLLALLIILVLLSPVMTLAAAGYLIYRWARNIHKESP